MCSRTGPAAQAGIRPGDVIETVGERKITDVSQLLSVVAALKPGTGVPFTVLRREQELVLTVTPGLRPRPKAGQELP